MRIILISLSTGEMLNDLPDPLLAGPPQSPSARPEPYHRLGVRTPRRGGTGRTARAGRAGSGRAHLRPARRAQGAGAYSLPVQLLQGLAHLSHSGGDR